MGMEEKMKKFLIFLIGLILMTGCYTKDTILEKTPLPSSELIKESENITSSSESSDVTSSKNDINKEVIGLFSCVGTSKLFEKQGILSPSTVEVFENNDEIVLGFIYEYGLAIDETESSKMPKDIYGNTFLYYGILSKISECVYSSKGTFIDSWEKKVSKISDTVDFYIIINDNYMYFVFDEVDLKKIENYYSEENYAKRIEE